MRPFRLSPGPLGRCHDLNCCAAPILNSLMAGRVSESPFAELLGGITLVRSQRSCVWRLHPLRNIFLLLQTLHRNCRLRLITGGAWGGTPCFFATRLWCSSIVANHFTTPRSCKRHSALVNIALAIAPLGPPQSRSSVARSSFGWEAHRDRHSKEQAELPSRSVDERTPILLKPNPSIFF